MEGHVDLDKIEGTDTMLFSEEAMTGAGSGITGFATFLPEDIGSSFGFYLGWGIFIAILCFSGVYGVRSMRVSSWKKEKDVRALFSLIADSERAIAKDDIDKARSNYTNIQSLYSAAPDACRQHLYKKVCTIKQNIDVADVSRLVDEFISAIKEKRRSNALTLYKDIQSIYEKIPQSEKSKVYSRISPYVEALNLSGSK